jgi:hypothetical protein
VQNLIMLWTHNMTLVAARRPTTNLDHCKSTGNSNLSSPLEGIEKQKTDARCEQAKGQTAKLGH